MSIPQPDLNQLLAAAINEQGFLFQQRVYEEARRGVAAEQHSWVLAAMEVRDTLALWLTARYAFASRKLSEPGGKDHWRQMREFCADLVELRRGDHSAERLRLERERLELERQSAEGMRNQGGSR